MLLLLRGLLLLAIRGARTGAKVSMRLLIWGTAAAPPVAFKPAAASGDEVAVEVALALRPLSASRPTEWPTEAPVAGRAGLLAATTVCDWCV